MLSLVLLLPALAAAFPGLEPRVCGDNCARAVIASAYTTRHGAADCSSYLLTTVTPAISTITETSTLSVTPVETIPSTQTSTTTTTVGATIRITVPGVVTETVTSTTTVTSNWPKLPTSLKKRDEISAPSIIPAYASPCSGAARYTTACACVGVFPSTVTAATPLATTTTYVTQSHTSTVTQIVTIETETATVTTDVVSWVTPSTTIVTAIATATLPAFRLRVSGGDYNNRNVYPDSRDSSVMLTRTTSSGLWTLDTETNTLIDTRTGYSLYVSRGDSSTPSIPEVLSAGDAASAADVVLANCWVYAYGSNMALQCEEPNSNNLWITAASTGDEQLFLGSSSLAGQLGFSSALTLQLVGVDGNAY